MLIGSVALCVPGSGLTEAPVRASLDLQAGLGFSTNPLLATDGRGSGFGRVSAYGLMAWETERSASNVSAYVENSSYFNRYSSKQIFNLAAHTDRAVSERVRLFGDLGFSGDFGAMLSSRTYGVPSSPTVPDPAIPASFVTVDPDLYGLTGRQYRVSGQVGAAIGISARDSMNVSAGAQRVFTGSSNSGLDYNQFDTAIGYERLLDERLSLGGRLVAQHTDYEQGGSVTSVGPQATFRARLNEQWTATGAIGALRTRQEGDAVNSSRSSLDLAFDGSLCRNEENERLCARVARRTQSTILGGSSTSTSGGLDYYRRLNRRDTVQLNASAVRSAGLRAPLIDQRSTFYTLAASYDRMLNERLSAGVNVMARNLTRGGPDPKADVGGSAFVRYRLGDLR
jgi:hypothetical protein